MKGLLGILILVIALFFGIKTFQNSESLTDAVKNSVDGLTDAAKNAGDVALDGAKGLTDKAGDLAGKAGELAANGAKELTGKAGDLAGKAGELAGKAGDLAANGANGVLGKAGELATNTASSLKDATGNSLNKLGELLGKTLPNGEKLNVPSLGVESKLLNSLKSAKNLDKDAWFDFDRISFNSGSSVLAEGSKEQIKNIAKIMKAFPNLKFKVGGYTDNTGGDLINKKISKKRADAVKSALNAEGIQDTRLSAEGFGKLHPVATNDTKEGRAKNRRISLKILSM